MEAIQTSSPTAEAGLVLGKAILRSAERLGVSRRELASTLGVSEATLSRIAQGRPLDPQSKAGELALLLVRVFRSLDALMGGDEAAARAWVRSENAHLGGVPAELVQTAVGLVRVVAYLDALRGRN